MLLDFFPSKYITNKFVLSLPLTILNAALWISSEEAQSGAFSKPFLKSVNFRILGILLNTWKRIATKPCYGKKQRNSR